MAKVLGHLKCDLTICACSDNMWPPNIPEAKMFFHCETCGDILCEVGVSLDADRELPQYSCINCKLPLEKKVWPEP
jgi:hypothetical protein